MGAKVEHRRREKKQARLNRRKIETCFGKEKKKLKKQNLVKRKRGENKPGECVQEISLRKD